VVVGLQAGENTTVKGQNGTSTPGSDVRDMGISDRDREGEEEEVAAMETSTDRAT